MRLRRRLRSRAARRTDQHLRGILSEIKIPSPFDVREFCDVVAEYRGRPLLLEAVEGVNGTADELCGIWVELDQADCIFYEASTSPLHRDHIVLHEISHMLLGHTLVEGASPQIDPTGLFTGIDPATVRNVLGRASFSTPQEREAEELASRIASAAMLKSPRTKPANELDRIDTALRCE